MAFPNGTCADAAVIAIPSSTTLNLSGGADDPAAPCPSCAYDCGERHYVAWYTFTPTEDQLLRISTCSSDVDTLLSVWSGACGALVEEACSEDDCDVQSTLTVAVTSGTQYWIQLSDYTDPDTGDYVLDVEVLDAQVWAVIQTNIGLFGINQVGEIAWYTRINDGFGSFGGNRYCMIRDGKVYACYGALTDPQEAWISRLDLATGAIEATGISPSPWTPSDYGVTLAMPRSDDGEVRLYGTAYGRNPTGNPPEPAALWLIDQETLAIADADTDLPEIAVCAVGDRSAVIGTKLYQPIEEIILDGGCPSGSPRVSVWDIDTRTDEGYLIAADQFSVDENSGFLIVPSADGRLLHHTFGLDTTTIDTFRVVQTDGTVDETFELDGAYSSGTAHDAYDLESISATAFWALLNTGSHLARVTVPTGAVTSSLDLSSIRDYVNSEDEAVEVLTSFSLAFPYPQPTITDISVGESGCADHTITVTVTDGPPTEPTVTVTLDGETVSPVTVESYGSTQVVIGLPGPIVAGEYCVRINDSAFVCQSLDCANIVTSLTQDCGTTTLTLTGAFDEGEPTVAVTRNGMTVTPVTITSYDTSTIVLALPSVFTDGEWCATVNDASPATCATLTCAGPIPPDGTRFEIRRLRRVPHLANDGKRLFHQRLELQMQPGIGTPTGQGQHPTVMLRTSSDGGNTWSSIRTASPGDIGQYLSRVQWFQLGMARDRVYEVSVSDPITGWVLVQAWLDLEEGAW